MTLPRNSTCQGATPMSLEGAKKLSLSETEPKAKRARNDQQKKQGKTLRTWVASRWTSERFSMLSYDPDLIPILFDFVSEMGTDPVAVSVPASRFRNALYTTLDRSEALILRRFRGIRVASMSLGKVVGRSLRYRRKMRRDSAPFLGFRRDPRRDRSDLAASPVSARVGVRGPGRGGGCAKI